MKDRVYTVVKGNKKVMVVDYSGCNETEMIHIITIAKDKILSENKHLLLLSIYGKETRVTKKFMDYIRKETPAVLPLLDKQAVVGLDLIKKTILKGYNFLFRRNIRAFDSKEDAIEFLVSDTTTDRDIPDYMR
ncbi:MAG: hypothetical protein QM734_00475 [Cyclobacteriaceae bacterium]